MHLKRLELSGFKSFAKPVKMEFPVAISAIVGPNGSGKSNVAEAMRWVLGEQSMKSLRGKKGEDLIFNGSQTAPKLGKASVSLVFDNTDRVFPVDFNEVKITRKVFRDGMNEYFINDSQTRLKDIIELLSKIGLGASSHHIISQGEADGILNASAKERRQMIEDALGLKIYQLRKAESERKLEKTEDNIAQVEALRKEIQPHLKFLKKQVDKAQEALQLKDDLHNLYKKYFAEERYWINSENDKLTNERRAPEVELAKIEKELAAKPEDSAAVRIKTDNDVLKEKVAKLESAMSDLRAERISFEREMGRFEGMIEMEENRKKQGGNEVIPVRKVREFAGKISDCATQGLLDDNLGAIRDSLEDVKNLISDFLTDIGGGGFVPSAELDNLKKKKNDTLILLDKVNQEEEELAGRRMEIKMEIEKKEQELRLLEKEKYEMGARLKELRGRLSGLNIKKDNIRLQQEELEREQKEAVALVGETVLGFEPSSINGIFSRQDHDNDRRQLERMKIRLEDSGAIGNDALKEYEEVRNRDIFFEKELGDLTRASISLKHLLKELEIKIDFDFKRGVEKINKEFQNFFVAMFGGGGAELKVVAPKARKKKNEDDLGVINEEDDDVDAHDEGVDVLINLPKKKINSLEMLSGGERALTSIALLFAMSQVNPPPFLVLDETDAALDEANSQRYGKMLQNLSKHAQLVVITHNRGTMSEAGVLYGVTMGSDSISKLLSIKFTEAEKYTA